MNGCFFSCLRLFFFCVSLQFCNYLAVFVSVCPAVAIYCEFLSKMSEEHLVSVPNEQPGISERRSWWSSNKKALLVTGLTVLATLLIAGQAFTAYSVYQHSEKLSMLESRSDRLQEMTIRASANRTPMKMAVPMSSFRMIAAVSDKVESSPSPKSSLTKCQQEAAGLLQISLPSFKPKCDALGAYNPEQCWQEMCWCVDMDGAEKVGSMVQGRAQCTAANN